METEEDKVVVYVALEIPVGKEGIKRLNSGDDGGGANWKAFLKKAEDSVSEGIKRGFGGDAKVVGKSLFSNRL